MNAVLISSIEFMPVDQEMRLVFANPNARGDLTIKRFKDGRFFVWSQLNPSRPVQKFNSANEVWDWTDVR